MQNKIESLYKETLKIRLFGENLIKLFSDGKITGTTHTCIGQESNAVGIASLLKKDDCILSNHRCHGHFLAHTNQYVGLLKEILGEEDGVCSGIGGSQHLFYQKIFYSNGILGGNMPMATGLSFANKMKKNNKLVCLFIGDGSFGEGNIYESLNFISVFKLPILIVVEDNGIAQTTETKNTIANKIEKITASFKIETSILNYPDAYDIYTKSKKIINKARKGYAQIIVIKSARIGPHSKGDDTRSIKQLNLIKKKDPLIKIKKKIKSKEKIKKINLDVINEINKIFNFKSQSYSNRKVSLQNKKNLILIDNPLKTFDGKRFGELINHFFHIIAKKNKKILFFGEDIVDPYGGAFKITKNLKNLYKNQVFSTPISESTIVGMSSGLAIEGYRPIVEIMFGDFLSLAFDQILNNLSKFYYMYNQSITLPLIIRTPMGGGRGYGPTHSQSLEKFFYGMHGINIYSLNPFFPLEKIYEEAFQNINPNLIIENKIQYNFILDDLNNSKYKSLNTKNDIKNFITNMSLSNYEDDCRTIICHGGASSAVINFAYDDFIETENSSRIIILSKLNTLNIEEIKKNISDKGPIIITEESYKSFGLGSEIITTLIEDEKFKGRNYMRISSKEGVIPSSKSKEEDFLLSAKTINKKVYNND